MIKKLLLRLNENAFFKNVSTLAAGTILSQLILFAASPLLTRLFSAADFGILALFTSISTIAAIITTGRYELAIGLPKKDEDGANMVGLVIFLGGLVSSFYLFVIFVLKSLNINFIHHIQLLNLPVAYLIPVFTFFAGVCSAFQYWNQRKKNYKRIAFGNAVQVVGATLFNVAFGLLGYKTFGLIWGLLIGQICGSLTLFLTLYYNGYLKSIQLSKFKSNALEYSSFPKYLIISDFSLSISQQVVPIIFSILFNSSIVGYFSVANRMLRIPSIVLTSSIGNVFRNDAIDTIRTTGNCKRLYISTFKKLVYLSVPIYVLIFSIAPWIFSVFFGKSWIQSGYFAQIICIMLVFDFVASPLNMLFYILNKQKIYMRLQFLNSIIGILLIILADKLFGSPFYSILFFAFNSAVFSLISLYITYNFSKHIYNI